MQILPIAVKENNTSRLKYCPYEIQTLVGQLGQYTHMPTYGRNYCVFNTPLVQKIVDKKEEALPHISNFLQTANNEKQIAEALYTLDRMIDAKVKGIDKLYPVLAKFNDTNSPNIQVHLVGIYRKTQVPDAFGPLNKMLLRQTFYPNSPFFDPTEEIGGAILDYLRNNSAVNTYSNPSKI